MPLKLKPLRKIKTKTVLPPKVGEIIEGTLAGFGRGAAFLDLGPKGIGIIYGVEFYRAKEILKGLKTGDRVSAKVLEFETEEGYRELSLIDASKEATWKELKEIKENNQEIEIRIEKANKGGLITHIKGIQGFLPVSHLSPEHYPKVEDADPSKIAKSLQKFVNQTLTVKILDLDPSKGKLILSERAASVSAAPVEKTETVKNYQVGQVVKGIVSAITNFGAFVTLEDGTEALLYPSEIPEEEKNKVLKVNKKIKAKIINIEGNKIYLSLKKVS